MGGASWGAVAAGGGVAGVRRTSPVSSGALRVVGEEAMVGRAPRSGLGPRPPGLAAGLVAAPDPARLPGLLPGLGDATLCLLGLRPRDRSRLSLAASLLGLAAGRLGLRDAAVDAAAVLTGPLSGLRQVSRRLTRSRGPSTVTVTRLLWFSRDLILDSTKPTGGLVLVGDRSPAPPVTPAVPLVARPALRPRPPTPAVL